MNQLLCAAVKSYHGRNERLPTEMIVYQNSCAADQNNLYYENLVIPFNSTISEVYKDNANPKINWMLINVNVKTN